MEKLLVIFKKVNFKAVEDVLGLRDLRSHCVSTGHHKIP